MPSFSATLLIFLSALALVGPAVCGAAPHLQSTTFAADGTTVLRSESYTLDTNGNRLTTTTTRTLADGTTDTLVVTSEYDAEARVTKTIHPDGSTTRTEYNAIGKPAREFDALGRETIHTYDERGNLVLTTYPDGTTSRAAYDAEGREIATTNALGQTTYSLHDALGRTVATILPDGTMPPGILDSPAAIATSLQNGELADNPRTTTTYDKDGLVVATTDANAHSTTYHHDAAGRRTAVTDPLGNTTTWTLDAAGRQTHATDARGNTTTFAYDSAGRQTRVTHPDGSFTTREYDILGRITATTDENGNTTRHEYDALGRLTAVLDAEGGRTEFTHNELGQQTTQKDALGRVTRFSYDRMGRRTQRILPSGATESYAIDIAGRLTARTDFNGHTTTFDYHPLNDRLLAKTADPNHPSLALAHAPARHEFSYDALGRRTAAVVKNAGAAILHQESWLYEDRGFLQQHQSSQGILHYAHDQAGNLLAVKSDTPGGYDHSYHYDEANRLAKVWQGQEGIAPDARELAAYGYNANGSLAAVGYANGVTHAYTYDSRNRLTNLTVADMVATTTLQGYTYTLDQVGNRTGIAEASGRVISHVFDKLHRLRSETIAGTATATGSVSYALDAVGNRLARNSTVPGVTTRSDTYTPDDHLAAHTTDPNGNTLQSPTCSHLESCVLQSCVSASDTYDFENRLIRRVRADGLVIDLTYDADGVRATKEVRQGTLPLSQYRWLTDKNNHTGYSQVVEIKNGAGHLLERRAIGHDLLAFERFNTTGTSLGESFLHYDGLGSVRGLSDATGTLTDTIDYDAFGIITARTGTTPCSLGYIGEEWDADLGMLYLRARFMNPGTGRFHTMDTYEGRSGEPLSLHKYLYAHANPVMGVDPSGMMTLAELGASMSLQATLIRFGLGAAHGFMDGYINGERGAGLVGSSALSGLVAAVGGPLFNMAFVKGGILKFGMYALGAGASVLAANQIGENIGSGKYGVASWNAANLAGIFSLKRLLSFKNAFAKMARILNAPSAMNHGVGLSGVIDPRTGLMDMEYTARIQPNPWNHPQVPQHHRKIADQDKFSLLGSENQNLFGFAVVPDGKGGLAISWISRTLNNRFPNSEVPEEMRPLLKQIIDNAIGETTK